MSETEEWTPPPAGGATATQEPPAQTKRGRKQKAPKERRAKAPKPARSGEPSLFDLSSSGPSKDELDRMAAAELGAAIAPSLDLLQMSVPGASSPDEAHRTIESRLGPALDDRDAGIPDHPVYAGDALVYYQLRRHYGQPHSGGSFQRSWNPGGGSGGATGALPPMLGG